MMLKLDFAGIAGRLKLSQLANDDCDKKVLQPLAASFSGFTLAGFTSYLAKGASFYDGTMSTALVAETITSQQAAGVLFLPGSTIQSAFLQNPQMTALASRTSSTFRLYLRPNRISKGNTLNAGQDNMSFLFHEALHGYGGVAGLGLYDSSIQEALFGKNSSRVGAASVNISNFIRKHCFK